jgi:N-acetylglucosamine-6-phosphate deacetylase
LEGHPPATVAARGGQQYDQRMPAAEVIFYGNIVLADRILQPGEVRVRDGRIVSVSSGERAASRATPDVVAFDGYLAPGYIDLHVHGGAGADFMDGTADAVGRVLAAHLKHGTTGLVATTTAARHEQILATLAACRQYWPGLGGETRSARSLRGRARLLGVHLYGPYFRAEARGCHPGDPIRPPLAAEYEQYLAGGLVATASVAPELPGAEQFVRSCLTHNVRACAGHTYATFDQMADAVRWGVRHVDHLFCAMSDRAKLRQEQTYPMRGGVLEATLFFDELTTEVIADGKHLSAELLLLARKLKGPDRLALVTDCNRALDLPDGEYSFGPREAGEPFVRHDDVGLTLDRRALASSVRGMDHMVRTFVELTDCPLWEAVRMASLTPARIAGFECELGSIEPGKRADLLVLSRDLHVEGAYIEGVREA